MRPEGWRWSGYNNSALNRVTAGAERSSALRRAILALVIPTHKRHFAGGRRELLISRTAGPSFLRVVGSARFHSCLWAAEPRSATARDGLVTTILLSTRQE